MSPTSPQQVGNKSRQDTTDTTDFYRRQLVTDLLRTCRLCCGLIDGT